MGPPQGWVDVLELHGGGARSISMREQLRGPGLLERGAASHASGVCGRVSSLRTDHANLPCIVRIWTDVRETRFRHHCVCLTAPVLIFVTLSRACLFIHRDDEISTDGAVGYSVPVIRAKAKCAGPSTLAVAWAGSASYALHSVPPPTPIQEMSLSGIADRLFQELNLGLFCGTPVRT